MAHRLCRNCEGFIEWGVVCWFCVRAYLGGLLTAAGAATAAWLW